MEIIVVYKAVKLFRVSSVHPMELAFSVLHSSFVRQVVVGTFCCQFVYLVLRS